MGHTRSQPLADEAADDDVADAVDAADAAAISSA